MRKKVKVFLATLIVAAIFSFLIIPTHGLFACDDPPPPPPDDEVCVDVDLEVETDAQQTFEVTKEIELVEDECEEADSTEGTAGEPEDSTEGTAGEPEDSTEGTAGEPEESVVEEECAEEPCDVEIVLEEGETQDIEETITVEVVDPVDFVTYFIDVNTVVKNEHDLNIVFVDDVVTSIFMEYTDNPGFWLLVEEIPVYTDEWFDGVPGNGDDIILAGQEETYSVHREYYYLYGTILNWKAESVVFNHVFEPEGCKIVRVDAINGDEDCEESPKAAEPEPINIIDEERLVGDQTVASFTITGTSETPDYIEQDGKTARVDFYGVTGPKEIKIWKTIYGEKCGSVKMVNEVWTNLNNWCEPTDTATACIEVKCPPPDDEKPKDEPKEDISTVAAAPAQTVIEETAPVAELPYTGASPIIPFAGLGLVLSGLGGVIASVIRRKKQ